MIKIKSIHSYIILQYLLEKNIFSDFKVSFNKCDDVMYSKHRDKNCVLNIANI
jgi:hypothetical protein